MNITEVREGFIKFETDKRVSLSEFFQIKGLSKDYIAQIVRVKNNGVNHSAYAKLLYVYDGIFKRYDKTLPDTTAEVVEFPYEMVQDAFNTLKPVIAGKFVNGEEIKIDRSCFDTKTLVSFDNPEITNTFVSNISRQFELSGNSLIIDMQGNISGDKYSAGVDFKLPLNKEALEFIYKDCLDDATAESKDLIKGIFAELAAYAETVPFLPFDSFKTIVDDMVDRDHIFKLIVLKNKLAKFEQLGYFAKSSDESNNLSHILSEKSVVIDLSKLDGLFQNRYLKVILSQISEMKQPPLVILQASNNIDKANLKTIITDKTVSKVLITHSRFKYLAEIKDLFKNYVVEPTLNNKEIFKLYSVFLNEADKNSYLIVGEGTNYVPIISKVERLVIKEPEPADEVINGEPEENKEEGALSLEELEYAEQVGEKEEQDLGGDIEEIDSELTEVEESDDENITEEDGSSQHTSDVDPILSFGDSDSEEGAEDSAKEEAIEFKETYHEPLPEFHTNVDSTSYTEISETIESEDSDESKLEAEDEVLDSESETPDYNNVNPVITEGEMAEELTEVVSDKPEKLPDENVDSIEENLPDESNSDSELLEIADSNEELSKQLSNEEIISDDELIDGSVEVLTEENADDIEKISAVEVDAENTETAIQEGFESDEDTLDIELPEELESELIDEGEISEELTTNESVIEEVPTNEAVAETTPDEVIPLEDSFEEIEEIKELDESEFKDGDVLVELDDPADSVEELMENNNSELEQEIVEDVDKVFTTIKDDSITDSDLDFIDELNDFDSEDEGTQELIMEGEFEELENFESDNSDGELTEPIQELSSSENKEDNKEILEEKSLSTSFVPVYEAEIPQEDRVVSDEIEQGDSVIHAKYGAGVVEKMIKYGSKHLYSINFDNVGRRLLDPTLTEIKKA